MRARKAVCIPPRPRSTGTPACSTASASQAAARCSSKRSSGWAWIRADTSRRTGARASTSAERREGSRAAWWGAYPSRRGARPRRRGPDAQVREDRRTPTGSTIDEARPACRALSSPPVSTTAPRAAGHPAAPARRSLARPAAWRAPAATARPRARPGLPQRGGARPRRHLRGAPAAPRASSASAARPPRRPQPPHSRARVALEDKAMGTHILLAAYTDDTLDEAALRAASPRRSPRSGGSRR